MNYYLGIDIGTTSTKAVAFSDKGEVLESHSFEYEIEHPQPGFSEQNPDEIFDAVANGINKITQQFSQDTLQFIAFSAAMHSLIVVDENNSLLTQCIIWADARSASIAEELKQTEEGKKFYQNTGVPIHSMSPLCKILWLKKHQLEIFQKAAKFIGIKEYVFYKLFGKYESETATASATGLLNLKTLEWDKTVLNYLEVKATQLPEVVPVYQTYYWQKNAIPLQLPEGIPFVAGASDGALSNIGAGAVESNAMAVNIGTSSAARVLLPKPETDEHMRTFCYHAKDEKYIVGGASNNGAVVLQWLKEHMLQTDRDFNWLFEQAATVLAGSDGLLLLPFIMGERAPIWNANATGSFIGMNSRHTTAHFIRATMEGVIYAVYSIGKIVLEKHPVTVIYASGGFAKSHLWLQILAEVFNVKVCVADAAESTALGAVIIGAEALKLPLQIERKTTQTYLPDSHNYEIYQLGFQKYERIYELLKGEM